MGTITLALLWCDGICVPTLWLFDAIEGGSDLSTSDHVILRGLGVNLHGLGFMEKVCSNSLSVPQRRAATYRLGQRRSLPSHNEPSNVRAIRLNGSEPGPCPAGSRGLRVRG